MKDIGFWRCAKLISPWTFRDKGAALAGNCFHPEAGDWSGKRKHLGSLCNDFLSFSGRSANYWLLSLLFYKYPYQNYFFMGRVLHRINRNKVFLGFREKYKRGNSRFWKKTYFFRILDSGFFRINIFFIEN